MKEKSELISRLENLIVEFKDEPVIGIPVPPSSGVTLQLKRGDKGPEVGKVQTRFKALGFQIEIDDDFETETESVTKQFQEANQIATTGIIGPQTYAALFSPGANGPIKVFGSLIAAAEIARIEAKKELHWRDSGGVESEAEKYLASVRKLIHEPTERFPWCAAFVFWCMLKAGIDMSHLGTGAAYVPSWVAWAKSKGYWHPHGEKSFNPRLGDIVTFDWDDMGTEDPEHIGFVLSYDGGSYIETAEGNTSTASDGNGDSTALRTRHWDLIEGFIRIA